MNKEIKMFNEVDKNPTEQLWRAVLGQAFQDAFGPERYDTSAKERIEARVFLTDYQDVSFVNVCENAGFNPNFVARTVESTIDKVKMDRNYLFKLRTQMKGTKNDNIR